MSPHKLKLSRRFAEFLTFWPESGMGYQLVKVILKSGEVLRRHKVLNSEILVLEAGETLKETDIIRIEPDA